MIDDRACHWAARIDRGLDDVLDRVDGRLQALLEQVEAGLQGFADPLHDAPDAVLDRGDDAVERLHRGADAADDEVLELIFYLNSLTFIQNKIL